MILDFNQCRRSAVGLAAAVVFCLATSPAFSAAKAPSTKAPHVVFSPRGGVFATNVSVKLSAADGATLRFTLDGSEPAESSPAYSAPLRITNTTLVRVKAFAKGAPPVAVAAEVYTMLEDDLAEFSSNLPLVFVNSFGQGIPHERKVEGAVQVVDGGRQRTKWTSTVDFSGRCLINVRGRASLRYPKNSFTVKTINGEGDPANVSILGFPPESDWILYAPFPDKTLLRDVLAYELHREMGHWAPRTRFVEVFLNQTGRKVSRRDYVGVYVFEERIKRDKGRVNVAKLTPEDDREPRITGGYIFKKDHVDSAPMVMGGDIGGYGMGGGTSSSTRAGFPTGPGGFPADPRGFQPAARSGSRSSSSSSSRSSRSTFMVITNHFGFALDRDAPRIAREIMFRDDFEYSVREEEGFRTIRTNEFYFVEPEPDEITAVQKAWLKNHLNELETVLYGPHFADATQGYRAYIDPLSFIDYHLIVETTKNVDGFRFSVFFHKDRGGKIKADPIWDWNLSFGNANGKQGWIPEFWLWPQLDDREYSWYRRLFEDSDFAQQYVDRWSMLRTNVFSTKGILSRIDELAVLLDEAQKRNFEKWPILGRPVNPNYFVGNSYAEEVAWMKKFIQTRLDWMEKQFVAAPKVLVKSQGGARLAELSASEGEIYFTIDGSDSRASGGLPAQAAQVYKTPIELRPGAKLFARVRHENRWSGPLVNVE